MIQLKQNEILRKAEPRKKRKKQERKMEKEQSRYLVGDLPCIVFQGKLWQWHLWPGIERIVSMVIVALLKEGVVCCLAMIGDG